MITGLRRSVLYVPCDSERMLRKAAGTQADLLLLNLEDGIAASRKEAARVNAVWALTALDFGAREVAVRVNSTAAETGMLDLAAVVPCRPDGICLPKIEGAAALRAAEAAALLEKRAWPDRARHSASRDDRIRRGSAERPRDRERIEPDGIADFRIGGLCRRYEVCAWRRAHGIALGVADDCRRRARGGY